MQDAEQVVKEAQPVEADVAQIDRLRTLHQQLRSELARVIIGQDTVI